jgi:hypothetical protein
LPNDPVPPVMRVDLSSNMPFTYLVA